MLARVDPTLLEASLEQLDARIGAALTKGALGSRSASEAECRQAGRRWFEANLTRLQVCVCAHPTVRAHCAGAAAERAALVASVADALARSAEIRLVPSDVLAARLVHFGLERLCAARPPGT